MRRIRIRNLEKLYTIGALSKVGSVKAHLADADTLCAVERMFSFGWR
jgi:hypothetical protein